MKYCIYLLLKNNYEGSLLDRLFYVGQTCNIKSRMSSHRRCDKNHNNPIKNAIIKKYGFEYIVLWDKLSKSEADEREQFLIRYFGKSCNNTGILSNLSDGGDFYNPIYSEEDIQFHLKEIQKLEISCEKYSFMVGINIKTITSWVKQNNLEDQLFIRNSQSRREKYRKLYEESGMHKREFCRKHKIHTRILTVSRKVVFFTDNEVEFLKTNFCTMSDKDMALKLNRSASSVKNKCLRLGLYRNEQ